MEHEADYRAYIDQTATVVGLPLPVDYHQGVVENFERIAAIAQLVMEFPLDEAIEIAPVFEP